VAEIIEDWFAEQLTL